MDREMEMQNLNKADAGIAEAEQHIAAQRFLVERLRMTSQDRREAEHLLETMEMVLAACYQHRRTLLKQIDQINAGLA